MGQAESTTEGLNNSMQSMHSVGTPARHSYSTGNVESYVSMQSVGGFQHAHSTGSVQMESDDIPRAEGGGGGGDAEGLPFESQALAELQMLRDQMKSDKDDFENKIRLLEKAGAHAHAVAPAEEAEGADDNDGAKPKTPPNVVTGKRWVAVLADAVIKRSTSMDVTEKQLYHQLMAALHDVILECPSHK